MTYASLMVNLEPGTPNTGVLKIAGNIVERFHARVIGIVVCQPMQMPYSDGYVSIDLVQIDHDRIKGEIATAKAAFHAAFGPSGERVEWRSTSVFTSASDYLAGEARSADLIISGTMSGSAEDDARGMNLGALIMQAGRPVLAVPANAQTLKLDTIVVAWKDTREARRAIVNALPLLKMALHVAIVEIAGADELSAARIRLKDVARWLGHHGVAAEPMAVLSNDSDAAQLNDIAETRGAGIIVAGAYGHSRLREWAFGGVTRDLLQRTDRCFLVSH